MCSFCFRARHLLQVDAFRFCYDKGTVNGNGNNVNKDDDKFEYDNYDFNKDDGKQ